MTLEYITEPFERPSVDSLIDTLAALLDEAMEHRLRQRGKWEADGKPEHPWEVICACVLLETPHQTLIERDWAKDPVYRALKSGVETVGRLVFDRIGDDAMLGMAEAVCDRDPDNWGKRMSFLNAAFDGIGHWHA